MSRKHLRWPHCLFSLSLKLSITWREKLSVKIMPVFYWGVAWKWKEESTDVTNGLHSRVFPSLDKFHSTLLTFWYHWRPQAHFQGLQDIVLTIIPTWKDQLSTPPQFTCFLGWFTQRKISLSLILGHTAHCMHDRTWAGSFVGAVGVMETWKSRVKHIK